MSARDWPRRLWRMALCMPYRKVPGWLWPVGIVVAVAACALVFSWLEGRPSPAQREAAKMLGIPVRKTLDLGNGVQLKLILIPPGWFAMGSPADEADRGADETLHRVRITRPFYMGVTEVTQEQWEAVMGTNPSHFKGAKNPVEQVSWNDAQEFCKKISDKLEGHASSWPNGDSMEGHASSWPTGDATERVPPRPNGDVTKRVPPRWTARLPTESEWEYACRAGSTTRFSFGDSDNQIGPYAWFGVNSGKRTHPVGQKKPNAWRLYDMHGNIWEWCEDWFELYPIRSADDPGGPVVGEVRVLRGGSWFYYPGNCRSANRFGRFPGIWLDHYGLRVVVSPRP